MAVLGAVAWYSVVVIFPLELEKQMKIENLFVTWQQRSAQSNMPISVSAAWAGGQVGSRLGFCTARWKHQVHQDREEHWSSERVYGRDDVWQ